MDRHFSSRLQGSGPRHVGAAFYGPKLHALGTVQLQTTGQLPESSLVESLRKALVSAISEIKVLKEENKALKEQIYLRKNESQVEVSQLQETLTEKDELFKKATKAHMDCLALLAEKDTEVKTSEEHWEKRCEALKESLRQEMAHREEDWRRKVQEVENEKNLLCEEWHRKEEEWRKKESQSEEHINLLTSKNNLLLEKVKDQEAEKTENKEGDKVGSEPLLSDEKHVNENKERKTKEDQEEVRQLQEKLKEKDELIKRITKKRQARTKAHMDCLALLVKKHTEVKTSEEHWEKRCEALKESLQQEMAHREEDWRRKVQEVENEKNLLCEEWHRKEEEWRKKESQSDKHINLLTPNNNLLLEVVKETKAQVEHKIEEARQLQEKLKENNDLIKMNKKKIQACRKANRNRLALVAKKHTEIKTSDEQINLLTSKNNLLLEKVKDQEAEKTENKEGDKVGSEPLLSDEKHVNDKKERETNEDKGKDKELLVAVAEYPCS